MNYFDKKLRRFFGLIYLIKIRLVVSGFWLVNRAQWFLPRFKTWGTVLPVCLFVCLFIYNFVKWTPINCKLGELANYTIKQLFSMSTLTPRVPFESLPTHECNQCFFLVGLWFINIGNVMQNCSNAQHGYHFINTCGNFAWFPFYSLFFDAFEFIARNLEMYHLKFFDEKSPIVWSSTYANIYKIVRGLRILICVFVFGLSKYVLNIAQENICFSTCGHVPLLKFSGMVVWKLFDIV